MAKVGDVIPDLEVTTPLPLSGISATNVVYGFCSIEIHVQL